MIAAESLYALSTTSMVFVALGASLLAYMLYGVICPKNPKHPPVYKTGLPLIGPFISFAKNPVGTIRRAYEQEGNCFTMQMFNFKLTFLIGPGCHELFFKASDLELDQATAYKFMTPIFGPDVVYDAPLKKRRQQYKFLANSLRPELLRDYPARICKETEDFFTDNWSEPKGERNLLSAMASLTILTASATLLGPEVRQHLFKEVSELYHTLDEGLTPFSIFFPYFPTRAHRNRDKARKQMVALFDKVIRQRQAAEKADKAKAATSADHVKKKKTGRRQKSRDMLATLMAARYKDGTPLTVGEISGLLIAALFAGQHTSNITMTWTTLLLLEDKRRGGDWLDQVLAQIHEVQEQFKARGEDPFSWKALEQMTILHCCIKETIRLYPPLVFLMRDVVKEQTTPDGIVIPKGHRVMVAQAMTMRLPEYFPDPDEFKPSRWLGNAASKLQRYLFIGFGEGMHTCMGQRFAYMQIKSVLIKLLTTFELEMIGDFPKPNYESIVVGPKGDTKIRYRRRGAAPVRGQKQYSMEEVSRHNSETDCWIVVANKVYDVTSFLDRHPGGQEALLAWGGREATNAVLTNISHPDTVEGTLEDFLVGRLKK